ncbi:MAG TPA: hypothetical protein VMC05_05210 [Xanthobacteraceae bacterium]|nr:hypothetical protein [Xanthobacteraceae bacterium]
MSDGKPDLALNKTASADLFSDMLFNHLADALGLFGNPPETLTGVEGHPAAPFLFVKT